MMNALVRQVLHQFRYKLPLWAVQGLSNWLPENRWSIRLRGMLVRPFLGRCGKKLTLARGITFLTPSNLRIGDNVYIATGCWIDGIGGLVIEDEVKLSPYVVITTSSHCFRNNSVYSGGSRIGSVRIGKGSWLASHVTVVAGCSIGSGCVIGANSVVTKDVPDNMFAGGVPARVIGPRVDKEPAIFSRMDLDRFQQEGPGSGISVREIRTTTAPCPPISKRPSESIR
jgi:acetyltransferase-like isoleucine patch superfamily enzyme